MPTHNHPDHTAGLVNSKFPQFQPKIGIILSSGLNDFLQYLDDAVTISYQDLPGFPIPTVQGHAGNMVLGRLNGIDIVCLQGRAHNYENTHTSNQAVKMYVRTLQRMGCRRLIATNVVGSLNPDIKPGELMVIQDHINLQPSNPLVGPNDDEFGPRFLPVDQAYDPTLREEFLASAKQCDLSLHQGIYISVLGPSYETAAEIRAFRLLGADVVGMSTVPEVIVAHHCGMKVVVLSTITNYATGIATHSHDHGEVVKIASMSAERLSRLLRQWFSNYG